jgi:hypothetical protein
MKMSTMLQIVRELRTLPELTLASAVMMGWCLTKSWRESAPGWNRTGPPTTDSLQFDCFSEPSVAVGILRREAERSFSDVLQLIQLEQESHDDRLPVGPSTDSCEGPGFVQRNQVFEESGQSPARVAAAIKEMEELYSRVAALKSDLDNKLMTLYYRDEKPGKFLDRYLSLLKEAPEGNVVVWARYALECSQQCGRDEEALDALRHVTRFRPELNTASLLRSVLEDLQCAEPSVRP